MCRKGTGGVTHGRFHTQGDRRALAVLPHSAPLVMNLDAL